MPLLPSPPGPRYELSMTRRIVLAGVAGVAALWSPYIYAELARKPVPASSEEGPPELIAPTQPDVRPTPALFVNEEPVADEVTEPPHAEAEAANPGPSAAPEPTPGAEPSAAAEAPPAPPADGHSDEPDKPAAVPPSVANVAAEAPADPESADKHSADSPAAKEESADEQDAKPIAEDQTLAAASARSELFGHAFEQESRDALWANREEPRLAALLQGAGVPVGAFSDVRCQRTVCRVAFNAGAAELIEDSQAARSIRAEFGAGFALGRTSSDGLSFYLFLLRPGFQLD
jgi:hypothetical protein